MAEAQWIARQLGSQVLLLEGAGHHPHVEFPDEIAGAVTEFARTLPQQAAGPGRAAPGQAGPGQAG